MRFRKETEAASVASNYVYGSVCFAHTLLISPIYSERNRVECVGMKTILPSIALETISDYRKQSFVFKESKLLCDKVAKCNSLELKKFQSLPPTASEASSAACGNRQLVNNLNCGRKRWNQQQLRNLVTGPNVPRLTT